MRITPRVFVVLVTESLACVVDFVQAFTSGYGEVQRAVPTPGAEQRSGADSAVRTVCSR
jgi:hypothetical protein